MSNITKRGYRVTVSGQYYSGVGREKVIKTFRGEVFYVPETVEITNGRKFQFTKDKQGNKVKTSVPNRMVVNGLRAAQHIIQRRLLHSRLAANSEKYPGYTAFRTCTIMNSEGPLPIPADQLVDLTKPVSAMTLTELHALCAAESLVNKPEMYGSLDDARQAIAQELRESRKSASPAVRAPLDESSSSAASSQVAGHLDPADDPDAGITQIDGERPANLDPDLGGDEVPIDNEDPAASLM